MHIEKLHEYSEWISQNGHSPKQIVPLVQGAGLRCYFRVYTELETFVLMDASQDSQSLDDFIAVDHAFLNKNIRVPKIYAQAKDRAWLLLEDFGDTLYEQVLTPNNADLLYRAALNTLVSLQSCTVIRGYALPLFVRDFLQFDLQLWREWFVEKYCRKILSPKEQGIISRLAVLLQQNGAKQLQVCIHRDYHCRNLIWLSDASVGVLDFQNAMLGPITYDAASLLRDCYLAWPADKVEGWLHDFYEMLGSHERHISFDQFQSDFDLMGLQRHLKALGTFARKIIRDADLDYQKEIPRTCEYILAVSQRYSELKCFHLFFSELVTCLKLR